MDENPSKPPHSSSTSGSGSPPEPPSHGVGSSSTTKRKIITDFNNNEPEQEQEQEDNANITDLSTPTKRHQIESSSAGKQNKEDTATTIISPWIREDINLLEDIFNFYLKNGRYPYPYDLQDFFKNWVQERGYYRDEMDLNRNMERLNLKFLIDMEKKSNGEDIEANMDPTEIQIFRLSTRVWGRENNNDNNNVVAADHDVDVHSNDRDDVDTKDLSFNDWIKEGGISTNGSKSSSSKDLSFKDWIKGGNGSKDSFSSSYESVDGSSSDS